MRAATLGSGTRKFPDPGLLRASMNHRRHRCVNFSIGHHTRLLIHDGTHTHMPGKAPVHAASEAT